MKARQFLVLIMTSLTTISCLASPRIYTDPQQRFTVQVPAGVSRISQQNGDETNFTINPLGIPVPDRGTMFAVELIKKTSFPKNKTFAQITTKIISLYNTVPLKELGHPAQVISKKTVQINNANAYYFVAKDGIPYFTGFLGNTRKEVPKVWCGYLMDSKKYIVIGHCYYAKSIRSTFDDTLKDFPAATCKAFVSSIRIF